MTAGTFTTADGCALTFDVAGKGRPVLWQHGLGAPLDQPVEVFPDMAGLQRITLMCRGHGASALGDPARLSIAQFADDALALLDHLGVEQAAVGGISLGAAIALRLASLDAARVAKLMLARPAWVDGPSVARQHGYHVAAQYLEQYGADEGAERFLASPEFLEVLAASPDNAASLIGFFKRSRPGTTIALLSRIPLDWPGISRAQIATIRQPALVIGNDQDYVHPLAYARELAGLIPGARLTEITSKTIDRVAYVAEFRDALAGFLPDSGGDR
ncbi:alpha/beta hydrolase [Mesorhizobium sp. VK25A]|uniref:Alpha/beta hydrolase n=1 Tax=Mesorhizobium vachelliae TaxID=3072309 RepID=A0ABU5A0W4_9HYPH|nr:MULTISPECIES: alpha/beta hydrolase [unclassified Mesorhizobium]MDX8531305.1 alpha/beta hydrolase [Mesorhizobium sp. VK25D]MDX8542944.1 alpha/beta hydrolase [Mesorhizobium sp. VK25A]